MRLAILACVCTSLISGCGYIRCQTGSDLEDAKTGALQRAPLIITVRGYGALDPNVQNASQRRLMALRASELDAYRGMVERIKGVHVWSDTRVEDFNTRHDQLNAVVDSYLENARIVSQDLIDGGICETVLSLEIDRYVYKQLAQEVSNSVAVVPVVDTPPGVAQQQEQDREKTVPTMTAAALHHDLITPLISAEELPAEQAPTDEVPTEDKP